ncbi:caspase domain-containing protein [Xylaria arbuscula]|nr:caspase domain-containing protein [Xylaria arbuscula]
MSTPQPSGILRHFFVIVGIGYYAPVDEVSGKCRSRLRSLRGATVDAEAMLTYINSLKFPQPPRVYKLTSSIPTLQGSKEPPEPEHERPTYENIVRVLRDVTTAVQKDKKGIVHIHFSCHGIRVKTSYPQIKGQIGFDESIAPYDYNRAGRPLRDVELGMLIQNMTKHGANVSTTFDCCHAGSVSRGDEDESSSESENENADLDECDRTSNTRGGSNAAYGPEQWRNSTDPLHVADELIHPFKEAWGDKKMQHDSTWLLPVGYDMFGACCLDEKATEEAYGGKYNGVFTHTFIKVLNEFRVEGRTPTHERIRKRVLSSFRKEQIRQTPVFVGNSGRHWLRVTNGSNVPSLSVITADASRVILSEGQAQGVTKGSTYAIYQSLDEPIGDISDKPLVEVVQVVADKCSAKWVTQPCQVLIGAEAVLVKYQLDDLRIFMTPVTPRSDTFNASKYDELRQFTTNHDSDMIEFIEDPSSSQCSTAPFTVFVNTDLKYQLTRSSDGAPIPMFPQSESADRFHRYLTQLARFETLKKLHNPFYSEQMEDCLEIHINGRNIMSYCAWEPSQLENLPPLDVKPGKVVVKLRNRIKDTLNVTGINLSPLWGTNIFHPLDEDFDTIPGYHERQTTWYVDRLPEYWDKTTGYVDCVKFFISGKSLRINTFESVVMDPIDKAITGTFRGGLDLEELLLDLGLPDRGFKRRSDRESPEASPWITLMFKIRTVAEEG